MEVAKLDVKDAKEWVDAGRAELVDIREANERGSLRIPVARWIPLTGMDAGLKAELNKPIGIFHCQSGRRTTEHAEQLAQVGYSETFILRGGLMAWKAEGFPVESDSKTSIDIMRQVQIAAGGLVVLGVLLGAWVDSGFYWLSGLIGAGLVYSGVSGTCGLASVLSKLPFNR